MTVDETPDPALAKRRAAGALRAQRFRAKRRPETITVSHIDGTAIIWRLVSEQPDGQLPVIDGQSHSSLPAYEMTCGCGAVRRTVPKCVHEVRACENCQKNRRRDDWNERNKR